MNAELNMVTGDAAPPAGAQEERASLEPVTLGPEISIATAAYGNAAATRVCLEAISKSARGDFELILVDDCSPDGGETRSLFVETQRRRPNTKVFSFTENLEYSGSLNAILSHASGRWVLFVSNDIAITPCYLRQLLWAAHSNPRLGIWRGSSNYVDNGLPSHNIKCEPARSWDDLFALGARVLRENPTSVESDPFLVGDAFLLSRAVLDRIGTFDPLFFGYFADPDFGLRARIAGFEMGLVRGAFAWHQQHANFNYLPPAQRDAKLRLRQERVIENWASFKMKYGLPVSLRYSAITELPWARLAESQSGFDPRRHYSAPGDYLRYLL
jgi:GT2 family glycosyltransferase